MSIEEKADRGFNLDTLPAAASGIFFFFVYFLFIFEGWGDKEKKKAQKLCLTRNVIESVRV